MVKKLFGSSGSTTVGAPTLPAHVQKIYDKAYDFGQQFLDNPNQFFSPMGLSEQEQMAGNLLASPFTDPAAYQRSMQSFLSPYRDIITQDINKQFESPQGALAARASEAGAFGSSRHRGAQSDLERARLDAIANAMQGQYNIAQDQYSAGLGNLLNFGGLQRELDLQQRMAPVSAFETYMSGVSPLLSSPTYNPVTTTKGSSGLLGKIGQIGQAAAPFVAMFSDRRLKKNIKRIGEMAGLPLYVYEYIWSPKKMAGFMAHEVEKKYPQAVSELSGYKAVNYGAIA